MPSTTINPTRMELTRLKGRLKTAQRGHKLLKDKRDELMKQFMDVVRENRALRRRVEESLMRAHGSFTVASALMSPEMLEQALLYPKERVELEMTFQNVMSVDVPKYQFHTESQAAGEVMIELESDSFDTHEYLNSLKELKSDMYERYYEEYRRIYQL